MKTITYFAAAAIFLTACNGTSEQANNSAARADSLAQVLQREHIIDSMNAVNTTANTSSGNVPSAHRKSTSYERSNSYGGNIPAANSATPPPSAATAPVQPTPDPSIQRKANNKKVARASVVGGLIGAGAGAGIGALAGKNAQFKKEDAGIGAGAGAVLGAGAGYLIEKHKLKKADTSNKR